MGAIIDSEVGDLLALLKALGSSSSLLRDDLADFHAQARRLVEGRDEVVVLRTLGDQQLPIRRFRLAAPCPLRFPLSREDIEAYDAGAPRISDVYPSPISAEPRVAVAVRPLPKEKPDTCWP